MSPVNSDPEFVLIVGKNVFQTTVWAERGRLHGDSRQHWPRRPEINIKFSFNSCGHASTWQIYLLHISIMPNNKYKNNNEICVYILKAKFDAMEQIIQFYLFTTFIVHVSPVWAQRRRRIETGQLSLWNSRASKFRRLLIASF